MITFKRLTAKCILKLHDDTTFDVWEIFYKGNLVGHIRKADKLYLEVLYVKYTLKLRQRKFVEPIINLMCGLVELKTITNLYTTKYNFKQLTEGVKDAKGFTIKD